MPRPRKESNEIEGTTDNEVSSKPVNESTETEISFPQVAGNGKFQAVKLGVSFVVYNPSGQRVSGVMSKQEADNIVLEQNHALRR